MSTVRAALLPGTLALLSEYAGQVDPVPELRAIALKAVETTVAGAARVVLVASSDPENQARGMVEARGIRVARELLVQVGYQGPIIDVVIAPDGSDRGRSPAVVAQPDDAWLVIGNGSARRSEKAPGHLDPDAAEFDQAVGAWLASGDLAALRRVNLADGQRLLADLAPIAEAAAQLAARATGPVRVLPLLDADPYGVQWWVQTWEVPCGS